MGGHPESYRSRTMFIPKSKTIPGREKKPFGNRWPGGGARCPFLLHWDFGGQKTRVLHTKAGLAKNLSGKSIYFCCLKVD